MKKTTVIRKLCQQVFGLSFSIHKGKEWQTDCYNTIYYSTITDSESDIAFRKNFISRCPIAANYSDSLISLLHEMGHIATSEEMKDTIEEIYSCFTYEEYFALHDEMIATNWAIDWLNNKQNRKLAKKFEKKWITAN